MTDRNIIKTLEVSDFRGLGGNRTLDFDGADIVLLLGLNGFGKTSVFDSIEWCFTGKLARYERYTEAGRKQDFGKEKEVLRNKYATQPNTYVKVFLGNDKAFGRRVLSSGNESDYNMGSIIDGCEFGLSSLSREVVKDEFVNSYFSATHILSQETINDFVTSKKPEDRYKALSVNFGTSIFSAFESNIQIVTSKLNETDKDLSQQVKSKQETIKALNIKLQSQEKDIADKVTAANALIDTLSKKTGTLFRAPLVLESDAVSLDTNFEQHVNQSKSRASLNHSALKERLRKLSVLKQNTEKWTQENAQLETTEKAIADARALLSEIDSLMKSLATTKKELSEYNEQLKTLEAKKVRTETAIKNLDHYVNSCKRVTSIEQGIAKRNTSVLEAKAKLPTLGSQIENKKREKQNLESKGRAIVQTLEQIKINETFLKDYQPLKTDIEKKLATNKEALNTEQSRAGIVRSLVKEIEGTSSSPAVLKSLLGKSVHQSLIDPAKLHSLHEHIERFEYIEKTLNSQSSEIAALEKERQTLREHFSKSRQLLSDALSLINTEDIHVPCPVCDTSHEANALVAHVKSKLGDNEARALQNIEESIAKKTDEKRKTQASHELASREFQGFVNGIVTELSILLSNTLENESKIANEISSLNKTGSDLESKYLTIIQLIDEVLSEKLRDYTKVITALEKNVEISQKAVLVCDQNLEALQKEFDSGRNIVETALKANANDLSDIETLKDSKYDDVHDFLEKYGIKPSIESIVSEINSFYEQVKETEKLTRSNINKAAETAADFQQKIEKLLNGKKDDEYRKEILKKEETLGKLKQSLGILLEHLTSVELSPAAYSKKKIEELEEDTLRHVEETAEIHTASEELGTLVAAFQKFNADSEVRKKVESLTKEISDINARLEAVGKVKHDIVQLKKKYPSAMKKLIEDNLDVNLFNQIYELLNPHRRFKIIDFDVDTNHNKIGIHFNAKHSKIEGRPEYLFSSAQLNTFGICMFLSMALRQSWLNLDTILIDDPIQNLDDINVLSFIDFLRGLLDSKTAKKQIILSTHDERFYSLMLKKFQDYKIKTFRFESYGKIAPDLV